MKPLTCAATRRRLTAFRDRELPVPEQIAVAAHLEWCDDCAEVIDDDRVVGHVLRSMLPGRTVLTADEQATFPAAVVSRMRAERNVSWAAGLQLMFEDAHLMYAGAASAAALMVCTVVMLGMMRYATSTPRPESLAALINLMTPGSNQNPVVPRPGVLMPRSLDAVRRASRDQGRDRRRNDGHVSGDCHPRGPGREPRALGSVG